MKKFLTEWRILRQEYAGKQILDALFGGFVFSTLIFLPVFLAFGELIVIFMHVKELWFAFLFLSVMSWIVTGDLMAVKALNLKKPDHKADLRRVMWVHALVHVGFYFVAGIIFILFILPLIWV
jgi:hypothetical protein